MSTTSPDVAARFRPVPVVPSFADVCLQEGCADDAREAIESARRQALDYAPETQLLTFESGLMVDASSFVAAHASDVTPTSLGVPALRSTKVARIIEDTLDNVWLALGMAGAQVLDRGVRCAYVRRCGALCLVGLHELTAVECAAVLAGVRL